MTAVLHTEGIWTIGAPRLLAALDTDLRGHLAVHGALPPADPARLLAHLDAVRLRGRGGAGFPFADKLRALPRGQARRVVVNGSESEPASWKDRTLLRRAPHLVLDGALAVAAATRARSVTVAVHDPAAAGAVHAAIAQRPDARHVEVKLTPGGFVSGEERSVLQGLSGLPARPTGRREPAARKGDLLSNVETFAQVATLLRLGPAKYAETGVEPGTTLLTVGGAVARPGVVEVPLGTPLGIVLGAAGATGGTDATAAIVGGYHGSWHHPGAALALSAPVIGAGVVLALDGTTCPLGELARVAGWLAAQSAKQCGPCQFGLPALARDLADAAAGRPHAAPRHMALVAGRGACRHPDGTVRFVQSGLALLAAEVERHREYGTCGRPVRGQLPIGATR